VPALQAQSPEFKPQSLKKKGSKHQEDHSLRPAQEAHKIPISTTAKKKKKKLGMLVHACHPSSFYVYFIEKIKF
jgi:hypothetical protein